MRSTAWPISTAFAEATKQVALADRLVVSKTDLAEARRRSWTAAGAQPDGLAAPLDRGPRRPRRRCCSTTCTTPTARAAEMARWVGAEPAITTIIADGLATFCLDRRHAAGLGGVRPVAVAAAAHATAADDPAGEGPAAGAGRRPAGGGPGRAASGAQAASSRRPGRTGARNAAGGHRPRPRPGTRSSVRSRPSAGVGRPACRHLASTAIASRRIRRC